MRFFSRVFSILRRFFAEKLLFPSIVLMLSPTALAATVAVNFQTENSTVPSGYLRDYGQPYGVRLGANQSGIYGWVSSDGAGNPVNLQGEGRDRGVEADQRLDTLIHMENGTVGAWEIELPNGDYQVSLSVGDPAFYDSVNTVVVEGVNLVSDFIPTASTPFSIVTKQVSVLDGRLTVLPNGTNTKINYIEINGITEQPSAISLTRVADSGGWSDINALTDGNTETAAHKESSQVEWIEFTLPAMYNLSSVRINEDNAGSWHVREWNLHYWHDGAWHGAFALSVTPFAGWHSQDLSNITTDRIRLRVIGDVHPEVREFEVYGELFVDVAICGNGELELGEACDDGNLQNGDGCNEICIIEEAQAICGNGEVEESEECDDGNLLDGDGCSDICLVEVVLPVCGNGILEEAESCDDGNLENGDGCSNACLLEIVIPVCGNGIVEDGESCDDNNLESGDGCSASCEFEFSGPICGDNQVETPETCDDGNLVNGDGCSDECLQESPVIEKLHLTHSVDSGWTDVEAIIDDNDASAGHIESSGIDWVEYTLTNEFEISRARINEDNAGAWHVNEWQIQYWSANNNWQDAFAFSPTPVAGWQAVDFPAISASRIRLRVQGSSHPEVRGLEVYGTPIIELPAVCGDAQITHDEQCDDGNQIDGDGCSATCTIEATQIEESLMNLVWNADSGGWNNVQALTDGNLGTAADNDGGEDEWIEYALPSTKIISRARVNEDNAGNWNIESWKLQYRSNDSWIDLFSYSDTPVDGWHDVDFDDVVTDRVRIHFRDTTHVEAFEFELYGEGDTPCTNNGSVACFREFHLTARPWSPLNTSRSVYLDRAEAVFRNLMQYQNHSGAIIDPNKNQEWQYATPYFAATGAVLIDAGRASQGSDIWNATMNAMDEASRDFSNGRNAIPQDHGEFYSAPLATAYRLLSSRVDNSTAEVWRSRLSKSVHNTLRGLEHNWRAYAMKGEWLRVRAGLISESSVIDWLESSWNNTQRGRISNSSPNDLFLYHDGDPNPQTFAYESVSRMNIAAMVDEAYTGSAFNEMQDFVRKGGETAVKFLDPTGQGAANGRSGDHVWNDIVPGTVYERLAEAYFREGDIERAGRYRRAAMLVLQSTDRFRRHDCPNLNTDCDYSVTKNQFPSWQGVGYADYSAVTNYNGYLQYHLTESYQVNQSDIEEKPTWSEIGGYAFQTDDELAGAFINAGGMHIQVALRGQTGGTVFNQWWTALGVSRFSRPGWDSRLGPSNGVRDRHSNIGITFAPTFQRNGSWQRMASIPSQYRAEFSSSFVHPLLTRFRLIYRPTGSAPGGSPTFTQEFTVIPDGVYTTLSSSSNDSFGVTFPLLSDDGAEALVTDISNGIASTRYPTGTDQQNFIALGANSSLSTTGTIRSSYGDLLAVRSVAAQNQTFVYPRKADDPSAESVKNSFVVTTEGFKSSIANVTGDIYIGRTSAGGRSSVIDLDGDGAADVSFDKVCNFILQLENGVVTAVETDVATTMLYAGQIVSLNPFTPLVLQ